MSWKRIVFWTVILLVIGLLILFQPNVVSFFKSYPVPAAAILAATITVSGVLLSNWDNTRRLRIQLDHDRREKATEREFKLRQDVYLNFLGETGKLKNFLSTLQSVDGSEISQKLDGSSLSVATAQVNLCARSETSKSITKAGAAYAGMIMRMLLSQSPYYAAKNDAALAVEYGNLVHGEVARIQQDMAKVLESARPDSLQIEALRRAQDSKMEQQQEYGERLRNAHKAMEVERKKFPRILQRELSGVLDLEAAVVNAMRRDLEIEAQGPITEEARATLEQLTAEMEAMIDSLHASGGDDHEETGT